MAVLVAGCRAPARSAESPADPPPRVTYGIVYGRVTDPQGRPAAGVEVRAAGYFEGWGPPGSQKRVGRCRGGEAGSLRTATDESGFYRGAVGGGIRAGRACLVVEAGGEEAAAVVSGDSLRLKLGWPDDAGLDSVRVDLVLRGGSPELRPGGKALAVRIETSLVHGPGEVSDSLRARAVLRNDAEHPIRIEYGACALHLRAYLTAARSGEPVWRSERREPWEGTYAYGCPLYLREARLRPGQEFSPDEFELEVPLIEILGDSLPDARYHFSGALAVDRDTLRARAGEALLRLERPPLPPGLTYDAITFAAQTAIVRRRPTILRAKVTARLTYASGVATKISAACPLVLLAYRSRERRDAAPRLGDADARVPRDCGTAMREIHFRAPDPRASARPGEPLPKQQPGPPVELEVVTTAEELLGDSLPDGRYFLGVAVPMSGRTVYLSAGQAEIRR